MATKFFDALIKIKIKKSSDPMEGDLSIPHAGKVCSLERGSATQEPDFQAWGNEKGLTPGTGILFWHGETEM